MSDPLRDAAETMKAVRDRCVWSQQITHRDLVPYLVEESAELIDAVESGTRERIARGTRGSALASAVPRRDRVPRPGGAVRNRRRGAWPDRKDGAPASACLRGGDRRDARAGAGAVERGEGRREAGADQRAGRRVRPHADSRAGAEDSRACRCAPAEDRSDAHSGAARVRGGPWRGAPNLVALARNKGWDAERALRERLRVLQDEIRTVEASDRR